MVYICKQLKVRFVKNIVALTILNAFVEVYFRKFKWLLCGTNHLPAQNDVYYFSYLDKALHIYSNYKKVFLVGTREQI